MTEYSILIFFLFLGTILAIGAMLTGFLSSPRTPKTKNQQAAYECGIQTTGHSHIQFKVGYYLYALLFLVFDIETLFLFPAIAVFRKVMEGNVPGLTAGILIFELVIFLAILISGLAYAWRKGALKWD